MRMLVTASKTLPDGLSLQPQRRRVRDERHLAKPRDPVLSKAEIEAILNKLF